jgi:hypothetical protein
MTWHPVSTTAELPATTPTIDTDDERSAVLDAFSRGPEMALHERDYAGAVYLASHRVIQHDDVRQVWLTTLQPPTTGLLWRPGTLGTRGPNPGPMLGPVVGPAKVESGLISWACLERAGSWAGSQAGSHVRGERPPASVGVAPPSRVKDAISVVHGSEHDASSTRPSPRTGNVRPRARRQTSRLLTIMFGSSRSDGTRSPARPRGGG